MKYSLRNNLVKPLLNKALFQIGYRMEGIRYTPRQLLERKHLRGVEFDDVICRHMFEAGHDCTFVQIGAYDGVTKDPLRKYIERCGWRGVMLEPQPKPASRLRNLYRDNPNILVFEAALDRLAGTRKLYTVESDEIPCWAGGMASFERGHILKHAHLITGLEAMVHELTITCMPFSHVLSHLPSQKLDLLQIDAEGADGYILSLFPFEHIQPSIIHWESKNMTRTQQEDALQILSGLGYRFARSGEEDMLAVSSDRT